MCHLAVMISCLLMSQVIQLTVTTLQGHMWRANSVLPPEILLMGRAGLEPRTFCLEMHVESREAMVSPKSLPTLLSMHVQWMERVRCSGAHARSPAG